jgi:hypothetical protein
MAVDTSIAMGYNPTPLQSPINTMGQMMAMKNAQQENQMRAAQMANYQSEAERRNAMLPYDIAAAKNTAATAETKLATDKGTLSKNKADQYRGILPFLRSKDDFGKWIAMQQKDPDMAGSPVHDTPYDQIMANVPTDPAAIPDFLAKADMGLTAWAKRTDDLAKDKATAATAEAGQKVTLRGQDITAATARAGQAVTMRGQDMTAAEAEAKRKQDVEGYATKLDTREKAKREAQYPQATVAVRSTEADADRLIGQLRELKMHPGLSGITGSISGRTPSISPEATGAQALYDTVVAKGGFAMLQNLRNMSKTGGALGAVSDKEGEALRASFGTLGRVQSTAEFKKRVEETIADLERTKRLARESYDATYEYKQGAGQTGAGASGGWKDL